ncbi:MAG TPA: hypothetical protein VFT95_13525 [Micromonosporaceae bacterium]|nr:hypothetical protein [Micromonosporaceae bacterium]
MPQLSFYSAEANTPRVRDLAGLLCGSGQVESFGGTAARLSVVVDEPWRVAAITAACAERGVVAEPAGAEDGGLLVRTPFRTDLAPLAVVWTGAAGKVVPAGLALDGALLRLWAMAAGRWVDSGYLLELDPRAPETHEPLAGDLARRGLAATMLGVRGGGPGLRVSGPRRCNRLAELVGPVPNAAGRASWPVVSRVRATG